MKFNETQQQLQREGQIRRIIDSLQANIDKILEGRTKEVSYQLAYDDVYKLTKQRKQLEILALIEQKMHAKIMEEFDSLSDRNPQDGLLTVLTEICFMAGKISEICLFLDVNYCQKELNMHLKDKLSHNIFQKICGSNSVLDLIAATFFKFSLKVDRKESPPFALLDFIKKLDEKQQFFEKHFITHYQPLLSSHYKQLANAKWQELELNAYLQWARNELASEVEFVQKYLVGKKTGKDGLQAIIACIYSQIVTSFQEKLYKTPQNRLFQELTLPVLQLLKFGKSKDIQSHVQWYMAIIEKRLNQIPTQNNIIFLLQFCKIYEHITSLLKNTQNRFQIHYRSVFTFEQWINSDKFNLPLRLNIFIEDKVCNKHQFESNYLQKFTLLFKLIKEKTLFENLFRRMLLNRLIQRYSIHSIDEQMCIVKAMEQQCGEEWTKKITSIIILFTKNREMVSQGRKGDIWSYGELLPVVVQQDDWPFEQRQSKVGLHPQLLSLTPHFQQKYIPQTKNHKLFWSPYIGTVLLSISFEGHKRQFIVSIDAANLLLNLQKGKQKLANYLCETSYKLDQIEKSIQNLVSAKLIISKSEGSDHIFELNDKFESGGRLDLTQKDSKIEVKAMEELKADRKLMVEAIIVKIMKSQKVVKRDQLVDKTAPFLAQRGFNFNVDFVQKSIDRLLDKQFLRDFQDGNIGYIA